MKTESYVSPSHPFHAALEAAGHKLRRDEEGSIDIFVVDSGFHNGPGCELCGQSWCHHCESAEDVTPCLAAAKEEALRRAGEEGV